MYTYTTSRAVQEHRYLSNAHAAPPAEISLAASERQPSTLARRLKPIQSIRASLRATRHKASLVE